MWFVLHHAVMHKFARFHAGALKVWIQQNKNQLFFKRISHDILKPLQKCQSEVKMGHPMGYPINKGDALIYMFSFYGLFALFTNIQMKMILVLDINSNYLSYISIFIANYMFLQYNVFYLISASACF